MTDKYLHPYHRLDHQAPDHERQAARDTGNQCTATEASEWRREKEISTSWHQHRAAMDPRRVYGAEKEFT